MEADSSSNRTTLACGARSVTILSCGPPRVTATVLPARSSMLVSLRLLGAPTAAWMAPYGMEKSTAFWRSGVIDSDEMIRSTLLDSRLGMRDELVVFTISSVRPRSLASSSAASTSEPTGFIFSST
ncbi:hypothetical protein D3C72_1841920 [compost metagenome]